MIKTIKLQPGATAAVLVINGRNAEIRGNKGSAFQVLAGPRKGQGNAVFITKLVEKAQRLMQQHGVSLS